MKKLIALIAVALMAASTTATADSSSGAETKALISAASVAEHRSPENIARNAYRNPVETLAFFGLTPDMTVLEIHPGGLWYTEILGPVLKDQGQLIVAGYDTSIANQPDYRYRLQATMEQRFNEEASVFGNVEIVKFSPPDSVALGEPESVDMVLTFRNFHGWIRDGDAANNMLAFYQVLKPGGVLGVVQHRAETPELLPSGKISGYVSEAQMIQLAESAGFVLEASSEVNANPRDDHRHPEGVWTLPPSLRLGEENRQAYEDIGESDRMTLRFSKPE